LSNQKFRDFRFVISTSSNNNKIALFWLFIDKYYFSETTLTGRRLGMRMLVFSQEILPSIKMPKFWLWQQRFCETCCIKGMFCFIL
jgi:hypothetical protein